MKVRLIAELEDCPGIYIWDGDGELAMGQTANANVKETFAAPCFEGNWRASYCPFQPRHQAPLGKVTSHQLLEQCDVISAAWQGCLLVPGGTISVDGVGELAMGQTANANVDIECTEDSQERQPG